MASRALAIELRKQRHEGELQVEKLQALGIPSGPLYGKLKRGETIVLMDRKLMDKRLWE